MKIPKKLSSQQPRRPPRRRPVSSSTWSLQVAVISSVELRRPDTERRVAAEAACERFQEALDGRMPSQSERTKRFLASACCKEKHPDIGRRLLQLLLLYLGFVHHGHVGVGNLAQRRQANVALIAAAPPLITMLSHRCPFHYFSECL